MENLFFCSHVLTVEVASKANIQILATSDLHGWFAPWDFATDTKDTKGSLAYLATLIDKHRAHLIEQANA